MRVTVRDVMTVSVHSVRDTAGFKEIVELLETQHVSALPVTSAAGRVIGVVSEADLLLKEDREALNERGLLESRAHREARAKAAGLTARDLMTSPAITATSDLPVQLAARRMHASGVKRLPVIDGDGNLVGIVSRADLLRIFLRSDAAIRDEVVNEVLVRTLWMPPDQVHVEVRQGIVHLSGMVDRLSDVRITGELCASVAGVVSVVNDLTYDFDDSKVAISPPPALSY